MAGSGQQPRASHENVGFRVYQPDAVRPEVWSKLVAFAHVVTPDGGGLQVEPQVLEEVERQAKEVLGQSAGDYHPVTHEAKQPLPSDCELTFVPNLDGVEFNPPKVEGVCDIDGSPLIVRDDDKPEVIRKRLATYHEKTEPLVTYYDDRGVLRRVDGERDPDEVTEELRRALATMRLESDGAV